MVVSYLNILPCVAFAGVMSLSVSSNSALGAFAGAMPAKALLNQLATFYGQACAGSIFGARLGFAASEALKKKGGRGGFRARYYELSCPAEGTQPSCGHGYGNEALTAQNWGKHRLVLTSEANKCAVEARLTRKAEEMGLASRDLLGKINTLPVNSPERLLLEREVEGIYFWLGTAPADEVVLVTTLEENNG
jgi:formylmethanofuran dehydrogenase subunit E